MRALSAPELLDVWERGNVQSPVHQALSLLSAACPEASADSLTKLNIGERDARLLTLREWTFGSQLIGIATCPDCRERLELTFNVADIQMTPESGPTRELTIDVAGYDVRFRLPNSLDMDAIADHKDVDVACEELLESCLLSVYHDGEEISPDHLPAILVEAIVERMAEADPGADVQLALSCPSCRHQWHVTFDIVSFFWSEINAWAYHRLHEVHALALAYGWREADILAMSPWRRQFYLERVGG
ncbi:MAG TPA: phage baseplate protein [Methanosarcinales archaeon]|nr:MAG: phage baseplate protein [Methanosarcinales archaeon]HDN65368.1 phage baseplate protein [Methanosarcinales archaeon]